MQPSMFNVRVPLEDASEIFLMNTFTDAQLIVSSDVADLLDRVEERGAQGWTSDEREALSTLAENGFIVESRDADWKNVREYFHSVRESRDQLRMTVLTTLQCNFACDYCIQGDHGDYNKTAAKMSLETAARVAEWAERRLDDLGAASYALTFFGGEPLLNLPVVYYLAERMWAACEARGVSMLINIITNGLLLTPEVVDRLVPLGLNGVKITLDGDRETHNRMRPLRGGQGTFDRIIENMRKVAGRCRIAIGGNFDETSVDSYPALLEFLKAEFEGKLVKVNFKPIIRAEAATPKGRLALTPVGDDGHPLKGTCMTSAGAGAGTACDSCGTMDDKMTFLREETKRHGFKPHDGVHNGPCHVHKQHAHTIGPDGSLYACPGFTGQLAMSTGHVDDRKDSWRESAREKFDRLAPWKVCGDCAFLPVCAGGCSAAAYSQLADMNLPTCHKRTFESALVSLAHEAASAAA
jgi:uncharacterized protein